MPSKISDRTVERHLNLRLLPVSVLTFGILYSLTGYRGWLVFFLGTAGLWLLALVWLLSMERGLTIERRIHLSWATIGDSVPEQLKLINKSWLPAIWVEITDVSDALDVPLRLVSDVSRHATRTRYLTHSFKRRGLYSLGPTRLRTGDPFGVYTLTLYDQHASTILVTPPTLSVSKFQIASGGWAGDEQLRRGAIEREISDAGIRNYLPGDSLKRINWHASAHFDTLIVRQLEAASSRDWWICIDLDREVQAGIGQDNTLELSIVLAASLALRGLRERRRVGLALAGPNLTWLEPRADPAHRWRIMKTLAMAEAGQRSFRELLAVGWPARIATLILITPSTNPNWVAALNQRTHRGSAVALLVDPTGFGSLIDQSKAASALANLHIPYNFIPRSMLQEAYAAQAKRHQKPNAPTGLGKRYLQAERETWQSMD